MASFLSDDTVRVRSDGKTPIKDQNGKETGKMYPAWPKDSFVTMRETVTSGDEEFGTEQSYNMVMVSDATGDKPAESRLNYKFWAAKIVSVAIMVTGFEGEAFTDPRTGAVLDVTGDFDARLAQVRRLPKHVVQFLNAEIDRMNQDPLAPSKAETPSKTASGPS